MSFFYIRILVLAFDAYVFQMSLVIESLENKCGSPVSTWEQEGFKEDWGREFATSLPYAFILKTFLFPDFSTSDSSVLEGSLYAEISF